MKKQSLVADKLFIIFYVVILVLAFSQETYTQKSKPKKQPSTQQPQQDTSVIGTVLDSASTLFGDDPYAQFRNASYSNEGLISEQDEVKLSDEIHKEIAKKYKLINEGQARVNRIGQSIARSSLRSKLKYQFFVYEAKEINAFAIPGGRIYVASGLLKTATDDELASVLSHEVGHIVARHSLHSLKEAQTVGGLADLVGSITGIAGQDAQQLGKMAAQLLATPYLLSHSREQERESDFLGINNMFKAGYKLEGMVTMFEKLQKLSKSEPSILGSFFSSHPDVDERIENTRYEINRLNKK
jgi:predicted Zn-dependent protease